ncbi:hypothetical protein AVEN_147502-1 [Araneus ventricosus]|uniref:Uncharacterized protein n=1 Tax=Araneus ventricosus TaxID=182803 RepID=A0A4Y2JM57_ARAVE|nr:hypothetical protein AVEN_147502-1 [Araneus ventricosus]
MPRPPYCAMLLFELHEMADATVAVRLLYMNSTGPLTDMGEPHVLVLDDCSEFCPLENFTKRFQHLIPDDWEQECEMNTAASVYNKSVEILVLVFAIIVVICFILLFGIYCYSKRKIEEQEEKVLSRVPVSIVKNVT